MSNSWSIWTKLDRYPPVVVRLLAVRNRVLLSDTEIATRAKLSMSDVRHLNHLTSWDEVPVSKMRAFTKACGVDFANPVQMRRLNQNFRKGRFQFAAAKKSSKWPEFLETLTTLAK